MRKILFWVCLLGLEFNAAGQSCFYGSQYINSIDSVFLIRVMSMERQKDSEITNVVFYSQHERQQLAYLDKFLKNPFTQSIGALDFNLIQSAFDKYYQAAKIQLLYDLDVTAQPAKVLGFSAQPFREYTPAVQFDVRLSGGSVHCYNAKPYREDPTIAYMNAFRETARNLGELRILYPETSRMMKYEEQNDKFPDLGNMYKKMFTEDLKNIFSNFYNYIEHYPANAIPDIETVFLKEHNISIIRNSDNYTPFCISVGTLDKMTNGASPVNLINSLDQKYYSASALGKPKKTVSEMAGIALHGLNLIQTALRDTITGRKDKASFWISMEQLKSLNASQQRYFIGLIYQKDILFFNQVLNITYPTTEKTIIAAMEPYVLSVLEQLLALQDFLNAKPGNGGRTDYRKFMELNYNIVTDNMFMPPEVRVYFHNSVDLFHIYENVFNNNYQTTLYYTLKILNELQQSKQEFSKEMHTVEQYNRFMLDIAATDNNDQLKEVLKRYVPKK